MRYLLIDPTGFDDKVRRFYPGLEADLINQCQEFYDEDCGKQGDTGMTSTTSAGVLSGGFPFVECGSGDRLLIVINGGQGFVRRVDPTRALRDAQRLSRMLPAGVRFILLGYPPHPVPQNSLKALVDDLASAIRGRWAGAVDVAGISYGGILGCWLAARHPDLVKRLVLVASARGFSLEGEQRVRRQIAFAQRGDYSGFTSDFAAIFRRRWLNALIWLRIHLGRKRLAQGMNDANIIVSYLSTILEAGIPPTEQIRAPTLLVGGSHDQFFGDGMMEATVKSIPDARLHLLPGETHMAPIERAKDVAAAIEHFLHENQDSPGLRSG